MQYSFDNFFAQKKEIKETARLMNTRLNKYAECKTELHAFFIHF